MKLEPKKYLTDSRQKAADNMLPHRGKWSRYSVPNIWIPEKQCTSKLQRIKINPPSYFLNAFDFIINQKHTQIIKGHGGKWTKDAIIYNMFVRTTCAFDHNENGKLDLPYNAEGWRETGTFLKATTILPFIKSLGANTIHLLPITSIGADGNKGTLGSPYAIKNPYQLDPNLHEPNAGFGVDEEFKIFVQSAHHLGIRVIVEFVFRTSSKDADWIKEHPEWFYWIKEKIKDRKPHHRNEKEYGNPIFTEDELKKILTDVKNGRYDDLIPPHKIYSDMFTIPPKPEVIKIENGRYVGMLDDGTKIRIPGAFADWPPDDTQPPWGDVTYLKMYDHPDFNYIAYNTIRMYDSRLAKPENVNNSLWEKVAEIIPHYQHNFGIDGVMIDMGHALPMDLKQDMIKRARVIAPDFAFWDENFEVKENSVKEGYNAVIGYQWIDQHKSDKFKKLLKRFSAEGFPLPFFATPESHNTPRTASRKGDVNYSRYCWAMSNFIAAVPFIHSGFELGETLPINTGLDFLKEDLKKYPTDKLPLFSEYAFDWLNQNQFVDWIQKVAAIRRKYHDLIVDTSRDSFVWLETDNRDLIALIRKSKSHKQELLIIANSNMIKSMEIKLNVETHKKVLMDLLSSKSFSIEDKILKAELFPGQVSVCVIK
ncbi:MAG: alpha-amylase family glycosyl hydrolase [Bacteroidota bacterium]|nr:alpha-amylase family glycosyl hydrolase [Bacteroidota bacterium]